MCWTAFNGYNQNYDGVKRKNIDYVVNYITMKDEQATEEIEQEDHRIVLLYQFANIAREWQATEEEGDEDVELP